MRASQALMLMRAELADPKTSEAQRARLRKGISAYTAANSPETLERQSRMGMLADSGSSITLQDGVQHFSVLGGEGKHR